MRKTLCGALVVAALLAIGCGSKPAEEPAATTPEATTPAPVTVDTTAVAPATTDTTAAAATTGTK